jgi:serine/threonine-protein kinase HipA
MMNRKGKVFFQNVYAGEISETENGFSFQYDDDYLLNPHSKPISLMMPLQAEPYTSKTMLPVFDGIIPEGWLLDIAEKNWKIDIRDRMGLLLQFCNDCIGAISVVDNTETDDHE